MVQRLLTELYEQFREDIFLDQIILQILREVTTRVLQVTSEKLLFMGTETLLLQKEEE